MTTVLCSDNLARFLPRSIVRGPSSDGQDLCRRYFDAPFRCLSLSPDCPVLFLLSCIYDVHNTKRAKRQFKSKRPSCTPLHSLCFLRATVLFCICYLLTRPDRFDLERSFVLAEDPSEEVLSSQCYNVSPATIIQRAIGLISLDIATTLPTCYSTTFLFRLAGPNRGSFPTPTCGSVLVPCYEFRP